MTATIRVQRIGARADESERGIGRARVTVARAALAALAGRVRGGELTVVDGTRSTTFGSPGPDRLCARVRVHDSRFYAAVLRSGGVGIGESYELGWIDVDDLASMIRILIRSVEGLDRLRERLHRITRPVAEPFRRIRRFDARRTRADVQAHYDLGNEFFAQVLDPTLTYSCAVFEGPEMTLEAAQRNKLDRICAKLALSSRDHVVEIGTGWGSFAIHAAANYGCRVTTTTVSDAQFRVAQERVAAAGLSDRVTVLDHDFRELSGTFDKLVSVEMIEAVDWRDLDDYFAACAGLLADDGIMALQAIVIADQRYDRARTSRDFIRRRIFPGGSLPSIEAIVGSCRRATDMRLVDLEDLGAHYALTLRRWRERLDSRTDLAADDRFRRLFDFYLAYCEGGFAERHVSVVQGLLARGGWRPHGVGLRRL